MNYKLYWELTNEGDAAASGVWRDAGAAFPAEIEGRAITEIGDYCFAAQAHLPAECRCSYAGGDGGRRRTGDSAGRGDAGGAGSRRCTGDSAGQGGRRDAGSGWRTGSRAGSRRCAGGTGRAYITRVTLPEGIKRSETLLL